MSRPKTSEAAMARTAAEIVQRQLVVNHLIPLAGAWYHLSGYVRAQMCVDADIPMTVAVTNGRLSHANPI